jgi:hypothetical protein
LLKLFVSVYLHKVPQYIDGTYFTVPSVSQYLLENFPRSYVN